MMDYIPENIDIRITKNKIYRPEKYGNKVKMAEVDNPINIVDIHKEMGKIEFRKFYNKIGGRNAKDIIFEKTKIPPIAYTYYFLFTRHFKIPDIEFLCKVYLKRYFTYTDGRYILNGRSNSFKKSCIYGRICRAYNSFNREVELLYDLFKYDDMNFYYDLKKDVYDGIDININYNSKDYGILIYQNSWRAEFYRKIKSNTRHKFKGINLIPLPAIFKNDFNVKKNIVNYGDIGAFSPVISREIKNAILSKKSSIDIITT